MKIINKPRKIEYDFKLQLTEEEAKGLIEEIGKIPQGYSEADKSYLSKIFMVLNDTLEDLDLIPMTKNRKKGDISYPRLSNDEVICEEIGDKTA